ncbi:DUF554 domain-containing protein [Raineyella sp.]|uniref:DUF554 domain-containing protein n=1 Tax=Raineyella sp. TaxID=1911550 RepID=UPI002B20349A|nr:DUF554 domain-containing protein [Raineyella sp.]MEA5153576.1 DUF554 domain-containing protein [Raineyella sp.]
MFIGFGTLANVVTVLVGSSLGLWIGTRFPERTQRTVTDALGLITLLLGALSAADVLSPALREAVGPSAPVLIVLGGLLIGGVIGSLLDLENRLDAFGHWVRARLVPDRTDPGADSTPGTGTPGPSGPGSVAPGSSAPGSVAPGSSAPGSAAATRFVNGFVSASLLFCVGPLTVLGSLMEGLGHGPDQLLVKAVLDGFSSIAFAATLGVGVMASAGVVLVVQGLLTLAGWAIGDVLPQAHLMALSAVGGLILVGLGLRILNARKVPVANLLPALLIAPLLVEIVTVLR